MISNETFDFRGVEYVRWPFVHHQHTHPRVTLTRQSPFACLLSLLTIFIGAFGFQHAVAADYSFALHPNGSRVAVFKRDRGAPLNLFEAEVHQPLRQIRAPGSTQFTGAGAYTPDGASLLFGTYSPRPIAASDLSQRDGSSAFQTLWQLRLQPSQAAPQRLFDFLEIANVFPLKTGAIAFMGAVRRFPSSVPSRSLAERTWTSYSWMVHKPDGTVINVGPSEFPGVGSASLIRDEAIVFVQPRYVNGRPKSPREYFVEAAQLKSNADVSSLQRLLPIKSVTDPRLTCSWSGESCVRISSYQKKQYLAHAVDVVRNGNVCVVTGLPDRIEKAILSRDGGSLAVIGRPSPMSDDGYALIVVNFSKDGCATEQRATVPLP